MGYASENGYTPATIDALMLSVMNNINTQFADELTTPFTAETFIGTNFYKFFYALIQELQANDVKTSEIFLKLQDYFTVTNERISRPVATNPGIIEKLEDEGYIASIKAPLDADAGKVFICVYLDDAADEYPTQKLDVCTIIKNSIAAGIISQGTEVETIALSNTQSFDFKFNLPDIVEPKLRLTVNLSDNNTFVIDSPDDQKQNLLNNIAARYRLGKNFEPQRYFSIIDAPWAESVLLEWSDDGGSTWYETVSVMSYIDLFVCKLENITLVEA